MIIFRRRPKSSYVSKILTSLYKRESKRRGCHITTDSEPSLPMHPTLFSEGILEYEFFKNFMISIFNCYSGQSDPVQHLRQYQDKMVIRSRNDSILCQTFPFSLKGITSDWFYSPTLNPQRQAGFSLSCALLNTLSVRSSSRTTITSSPLK